MAKVLSIYPKKAYGPTKLAKIKASTEEAAKAKYGPETEVTDLPIPAPAEGQSDFQLGQIVIGQITGHSSLWLAEGWRGSSICRATRKFALDLGFTVDAV